MRVDYRVFRDQAKRWENLFYEASDFATRLGPGRVINISHAEDHQETIVTVWYWTREPDTPAYAQALAEADVDDLI